MKFYHDLEHPWVRQQNFFNVSGSELLNEKDLLSQSPGSSSKPRAWVLDLDSTLFCTGYRTKKIFGDFLREHPKAPTLWFKVWEQMGAANQRYSIPQGIAMALSHFVSEDRIEPETRQIWDQFKDIWMDRFFSNRYIQYDLAYPGAVDWVWGIQKKGIEIVYLTGRDVPRCWAGTQLSLRTQGFPMGVGTHLFLKPSTAMGDLEYKEKASQIIQSRFDAELFIDNEPENLVMFADKFPQAKIVFYHSIMSTRLPHKNYAEVLGKNRKALRIFNF